MYTSKNDVKTNYGKIWPIKQTLRNKKRFLVGVKPHRNLLQLSLKR